ncbi:Protein involved in catabolism of external DNA [Rubellimicrobium mesophilum DSM 19309]|uniref:Ribosomal RNA large subunit methyltransferase J n=1 Tax=Rubellimicrobium mesophilum DSM 19309 TaxID=442562 RepID=A0A017HVK0_9RHOB|nr:23S rRNA (adenine(2030)-N(6))-methyltransferase RlmJ [Rubellimicrobium mesophilum]EYD78355.1 Protein involved in catabolism of external DNA [Rubellimicrobium mesophilum DSM 19309]
MLSYQHLYHAGNLADVQKHALLAWVLAELAKKDKPLSYLETHAGRGLYDLGAPEALKTGEAAAGIERVEQWFPPDDPFARVLRETRRLHGPRAYPGSPLVAALSLRPDDRLTLAELHPREGEALARHLRPFGARIERRDGATMALSLAPPTPRRGLMLVDPSWEVKTEYETIPALLEQVHRRWNVGILMLWYPLLPDARHASMLDRLGSAFPDAHRHEVRFQPARAGHGMEGSGMFTINPPWKLAERAAWLSERFATLA